MRWKKRSFVFLLCLCILSALLPVQVQAAGTYEENEAEIYRFLREDLGLNNAAACGILGNIWWESKFDPTAQILDTNNKISYGLCQWNGGRFENLKNYCAANGLDYQSVAGQLQFLKYELLGDEKAAWQKMQGLPDTVQGAYTAGYNWARYFERCWSSYYSQRGRTACDPYYLRYTGDTVSRLLFFDANGGSCSENVRVLRSGERYGTLPMPNWGSNGFLGWYSAKSGGNRADANTAVNFASSAVLYARWSSAESFVKRLYTLCLGREPDAAGLKNWTTALQSGSQSGAQVAAGFFSSAEYRSRGQSDTDFVNTLYTVLLDRSADGAGRATWLSHLQSGRSRSWVFSQFCRCSEFQNLCAAYGITAGSVGEKDYNMGGTTVPAVDETAVRAFVTRLYEQCLSRSPDAAGLEAWTTALARGGMSGTQAAEGFVFSAEYINRGTSDGEFVIMLYNTLLNRGVDGDGYAVWTGHLAAGQSRSWVFAGIARSAEFRSLCASYGISA